MPNRQVAMELRVCASACAITLEEEMSSRSHCVEVLSPEMISPPTAPWRQTNARITATPTFGLVCARAMESVHAQHMNSTDGMAQCTPGHHTLGLLRTGAIAIRLCCPSATGTLMPTSPGPQESPVVVILDGEQNHPTYAPIAPEMRSAMVTGETLVDSNPGKEHAINFRTFIRVAPRATLPILRLQV